MLIDTHTHIHFREYDADRDEVVARAVQSGVTHMITVGTNEVDSADALKAARTYNNVRLAVGLHPNEADRGHGALEEIARLAKLDKVVAIGECGLDYYRDKVPADRQERALRFQIELAISLGLPLSFHVRDAYADFLAILDDYPEATGVMHCFTAGVDELTAALERGLYIALNGIMTFTKMDYQLDMARAVPDDRSMLETDAPYLSPAPERGRRNESAHLSRTAAFLADLRGVSVEELTETTTANARRLFGRMS